MLVKLRLGGVSGGHRCCEWVIAPGTRGRHGQTVPLICYGHLWNRFPARYTVCLEIAKLYTYLHIYLSCSCGYAARPEDIRTTVTIYLRIIK